MPRCLHVMNTAGLHGMVRSAGGMRLGCNSGRLSAAFTGTRVRKRIPKRPFRSPKRPRRSPKRPRRSPKRPFQSPKRPGRFGVRNDRFGVRNGRFGDRNGRFGFRMGTKTIGYENDGKWRAKFANL